MPVHTLESGSKPTSCCIIIQDAQLLLWELPEFLYNEALPQFKGYVAAVSCGCRPYQASSDSECLAREYI